MSTNADGLPSYNEIFKINKNTADVPLLDENYFADSIFGTATNVKFEWDSDFGPGNYSFLIRDPDGCLQAHGKVDDQNVTLTNINESQILKMVKNIASDRTNSNKTVHTFQVHHNNAIIGAIKFEEETAETCLKIVHKNDNPRFIVRSFKAGDFAIFRDNTSSTPICNIQIPDAGVFAANEFNGTIEFQPETEITVEEQLLCTAAAIGFKVSIKHLTAIANRDREAFGKFLGFVFWLIVVGCLLLTIFQSGGGKRWM